VRKMKVRLPWLSRLLRRRLWGRPRDNGVVSKVRVPLLRERVPSLPHSAMTTTYPCVDGGPVATTSKGWESHRLASCAEFM
jgi:hypothetical protein